MKIEPYLFFDGVCEEALNLYKRVLGAEVQIIRYDEAPEKPPPGMVPEDWGKKVMHANVRVGDAVFMASDGKSPRGPQFNGFAISLSVSGRRRTISTSSTCTPRSASARRVARTSGVSPTRWRCGSSAVAGRWRRPTWL